MNSDLSLKHEPVSDLFEVPQKAEQWNQLKLSEEQVQFYRDQGYLAGVRLLEDAQADALCEQLEQLVGDKSAENPYWYEYASNESPDPSRVLFHALGAWRIQSGFHDLLWNPKFVVAASQLLGGSRPILARPVVLQTGTSRWSGGVASRLFLLDAN